MSCGGVKLKIIELKPYFLASNNLKLNYIRLFPFLDNPGAAAKLSRAERPGVELVTGSTADTAHLLRRDAGLSVLAGPRRAPTKA